MGDENCPLLYGSRVDPVQPTEASCISERAVSFAENPASINLGKEGGNPTAVSDPLDYLQSLERFNNLFCCPTTTPTAHEM